MQKNHVLAGCISLLTLILSACQTASPLPEPPAPTTTACPPASATPCPGTLPPATFSRQYLPADWNDLPGWNEDNPAEAWGAFLRSCQGMSNRPHGKAWATVCQQARQEKDPSNARLFLIKHLRPYRLQTAEGQAEGMITGYYEPLLRGSRKRSAPFTHPLHGVPPDLLTVDLGNLFPELKDKRVRGRIEGNKVVPYFSRAEIAERGEQLRTPVIAYVDDAIELFFLHIQGSGRIQLPDGKQLRVNYADQNGHAYQSIGRVLIQRGALKPEEASMQGIQRWARAHPEQLNELLNANPSYVFFREVPNNNDGPIGALGQPLTPGRSVAIDPRAIPLGAPIFLATTHPNTARPLNRLMLAQDTGGAIKGAVRADFFWGFGKEAGEQAGKMKQNGQIWLLWPRDSAPE